MEKDDSIYGHDREKDFRYVPVNGRVPVGVIGYYPCCETDEPRCDKVAFHLPTGRCTEFLLGGLDTGFPRLLWRRSTTAFGSPWGVRLLECVRTSPCTREPDGPHEWWTWEWESWAGEWRWPWLMEWLLPLLRRRS